MRLLGDVDKVFFVDRIESTGTVPYAADPGPLPDFPRR